MEAFEILRWVVAVVFGLASLPFVFLNLFLLFASLAGHRMPSHLPVLGSVAAILALVAVPYRLPPWVWLLVGLLLFLSESAGSVRNKAVELIDAQTPGLRGTLIRGFLKDILLFIAGVLLIIGLIELAVMVVRWSTGG